MATITNEQMETGDGTDVNDELHQQEVNTCNLEGRDQWDVEISELVAMVEKLPQRIGYELSASSMGTRQKTLIEEVISKHVRMILERLGNLKSSQNSLQNLSREMIEPLSKRGIESVADWRDFLRTTERDSELIAEICTMLNTDVLQVKSAIASLTVSEPRIEPLVSKGEQGTNIHQDRTNPEYQELLQSELGLPNFSIGTQCAPGSRQHSTRSQETPAPFAEAGTSFLTLLRSVTCADPGIFKGAKNENFEEFIRRFKRKYGNVIQDDSALLEILGDDHLTGRAKSIYLTLPSGVKERGFEAVIEEMNKLLAKDSTAARIRALAEMKKLKIRSDQSVADFCLVIEKLGSIANPQSNPEERSIEYAQILLSNLEDWPEYVYLMSAVHKAAPVTAYDEIKQLAISIEQTRVMARTEKSKSVPQRFRWKGVSGTKESTEDWRSRYKQYYHGRTEDHRTTECEKPRKSTENKDPTARNFIEEDHRITPNETRKCYNCAKFGHIGRNCPLRHGQVNQVKGRRILEEGTPENGSISKIIEKAYSRGMRASHNELEQSEMIGKRFLTSIEILGNETEALIDTGSMVSILSIGILRSAQQRGIDVDALETIGSDSMKPVYDASNNKMKFLGAVYVDVAIKGGRKSRVPFHISQEKGCEVLLGTNALNNLGVTINISPPQSEKQHEEIKKKETTQHEEVKKKETNKVRVIKRTYIPPQSSALFMDDTLKKCAGVGQMFTTARNHVKQGRVFLETGAPEGSAQYYGTYKGVGLAKYLYVAIKRTATGAILPSFPDDRFKRPPRTAATRGSGMSDQDDQILTKKRRAIHNID
ncbi:hypothetical protein Y032_0572g141 [Ancylostoma ceylanicum]|uniref:CCHC-type domain-containing protein n=1 Tax=Ancylostoma ceylanicum TaxID=53326 RepID=A0A016WP21_9BILA|nr:hypothetical protein Y032_0572g141 [Ancylostoma ceylanicum]